MILRAIRSLSRAIAWTIRDHCAQYIVCDDCGTFKPCYTLRGAMEWLPYCGESAAIRCKVSRELLIHRKQTRAY